MTVKENIGFFVIAIAVIILLRNLGFYMGGQGGAVGAVIFAVAMCAIVYGVMSCSPHVEPLPESELYKEREKT